MIKNNDEALLAFDILLKTKNRVDALEHTLHHGAGEAYTVTMKLLGDNGDILKVPVRAADIDLLISQEIRELKADMVDQGKSLEEYFGF